MDLEKTGAQVVIYLNFSKQLSLVSVRAIQLQESFLMFEKAFAKVWYDGPLFKLTSVGLNRKLIRWIGNCLYQKKLIISINNQLSDPITSSMVSHKAVLFLLFYLSYMLTTSRNLLMHR